MSRWPDDSPAATVAWYSSGKTRGKSFSPEARVWPSMILARSAKIMLLMRGFSVCWPTAESASSSGSAARTRVASWRVNSASSVALMPRREARLGWLACCFCWLAAVSICRGIMPRSRSNWRTWRALSPSITPFFRVPVRQVLCIQTRPCLIRHPNLHGKPAALLPER